jgi:hypothetical protein
MPCTATAYNYISCDERLSVITGPGWLCPEGSGHGSVGPREIESKLSAAAVWGERIGVTMFQPGLS